MYIHYNKSVQYIPLICLVIIPILFIKSSNEYSRNVASLAVLVVSVSIFMLMKYDGAGISEEEVYEIKNFRQTKSIKFGDVTKVTYGFAPVVSYGTDSLTIESKNGKSIILQEYMFPKESLKQIVIELRKKGVSANDESLTKLMS